MQNQTNLISDFIDQAFEGQAVDAEATFNAIMSQKITDVLDVKRQEVASALFNKQEEQA